MPPSLTLPRADGTLTRYTLSGRTPIAGAPGPIRSRVGMAAVHVVANPLAAINPTLDVALDWDATLAFRRHIWSLGLAVAEAMDTSQRGMGFPWSSAKELIKRGTGPYFYLPKMESHLEARLWNDVFNLAQDFIAMPRGTIRGTVLIETILAAFEMDRS